MQHLHLSYLKQFVYEYDSISVHNEAKVTAIQISFLMSPIPSLSTEMCANRCYCHQGRGNEEENRCKEIQLGQKSLGM